MGQIFNPEVVAARNAPNSLTTVDNEADLARYPELRIFWKTVITDFFYQRQLHGKKEVSIFDGGAGVGAQASALVNGALQCQLHVNISTCDLIPGNVYETRKKFQQLADLNPGNIDFDAKIGDVTLGIPDKQFDLITYFELIHWLKPREVQKLLKQSSANMPKDGLVVMSYATKYNNALLLGGDGKLDFRRSMRPSPITAVSFSTGKEMTFFSKEVLHNLAHEAGLTPLAFANLDNKDFPTLSDITTPRTEGIDTTENSIIAFKRE